MKLWLLLTFLDSATPIMEGIVDLHNEIMFFLVVILGFVTYILGAIVYHFVYGVYSPSYLLSKKEKGVDYFKMLVDFNKFSHYSTLEIVWTLIPSFILILIVVPSFILLYSMDEVIDPALTLKVIGHQWYWSYEYSTELHENGGNEGLEKSFDSYLVDEADLKLGQLRLLEVDNRVVLPVLTHVRVLVTADDVLHSWAVPALGVKIDAVPGRLNQTFIYMKREGVFYGQCSELCGVNHGFMPIVVQGVDLNTFIEWLRSE